MGRPAGLVFLVFVSAVVAVVMGYGAAEAMRTAFTWRNAVLIAVMGITAIASIVNAVALWRRRTGAVRAFITWYTVLALTLLSTNIYLEWSLTRVFNLIVEMGLAALIGIILTRYVKGQLTSPSAGAAQA